MDRQRSGQRRGRGIKKTGERIRDKIAASKAKGMWMGGPLPLGYDVDNRLLVINEREAAIVRRIFDDFVTVRSATIMVRNYASDPRGGGRTRRTGTKNLCCCAACCLRPMVNS